MDSPDGKKQSKSRSRLSLLGSSDDLTRLARTGSVDSGTSANVLDSSVFGELVKTDSDYSFYILQFYVRQLERATGSRVVGCGNGLGCSKYGLVSVHVVEMFRSSIRVVQRTCSSLALSSKNVPTLTTSQDLVTYRYPRMLNTAVDLCSVIVRCDGLEQVPGRTHAYLGALVQLLPQAGIWKSMCPCESCQSVVHPQIGQPLLTGCCCLELPNAPARAPPGLYSLYALVYQQQAILTLNHTVPLLISPHVPLPSAMSGYALYSRANIKTTTPEFFAATQTSLSSRFFSNLHVVLAEPLLPAAISMQVRVHNLALVLVSRDKERWFLTPPTDHVVMPDTSVTLSIAAESQHQSSVSHPWSALERINKCQPSLENAVKRHCQAHRSCRLSPAESSVPVLLPARSELETAASNTSEATAVAPQSKTTQFDIFRTETLDEEPFESVSTGMRGVASVPVLPALARAPPLPGIPFPDLVLPDQALPVAFPSAPAAGLAGPWRGAGAVYTVQDNQATVLTWYAGAGVFLPYSESRQADTVRSLQALLQGGTSRASILACIKYILSSEERGPDDESGLEFLKVTFNALRVVQPTFEFDDVAVCLCSHVWTAKLKALMQKFDFSQQLPPGIFIGDEPSCYPPQPPDTIPLLALDGLTTASMYPGWYAMFNTLEQGLEDRFFRTTGLQLVHEQIPPLASLLGSQGHDVVERQREYISRQRTDHSDIVAGEQEHQLQLLRLRVGPGSDSEVPLARILSALQEADRLLLPSDLLSKVLKTQYVRGSVLDSPAALSVCASCKGYCVVPTLLVEYKQGDTSTTEKRSYGYRQLPSQALGVAPVLQLAATFRDVIFDTLHRRLPQTAAASSPTIYTAAVVRNSVFQARVARIKVTPPPTPTMSLATVPSLWQVGSPCLVPFVQRKDKMQIFSSHESAEQIRDALRLKVQPVVLHTEQVLPRVGALEAMESDQSYNNDGRTLPVTLHDYMKIVPRHRLAPVHQTVLVDEEQREIARETQFLSFFNALLNFQRYQQAEGSGDTGGISPRSNAGVTSGFNILSDFIHGSSDSSSIESLSEDDDSATEEVSGLFDNGTAQDNEYDNEEYCSRPGRHSLPAAQRSSLPSTPGSLALSAASSTYDVDNQQFEAVSHLRPDLQQRLLVRQQQRGDGPVQDSNEESPFSMAMHGNVGLRVRASSFAVHLGRQGGGSSTCGSQHDPSSAEHSPLQLGSVVQDSNLQEIDSFTANPKTTLQLIAKPSVAHSQWRKKADLNTPAEQAVSTGGTRVSFTGVTLTIKHKLDSHRDLLARLLLRQTDPLATLCSLANYPEVPATQYGVVHLQAQNDTEAATPLVRELLVALPPMLGAVLFAATSQLGVRLSQLWFEMRTLFSHSQVAVPMLAVDTPVCARTSSSTSSALTGVTPGSCVSQRGLGSPSSTPGLTSQSSSPSLRHLRAGSPQVWERAEMTLPPFVLGGSNSYEPPKKDDRFMPPSPKHGDDAAAGGKPGSAQAALHGRVLSFLRPLVRLARQPEIGTLNFGTSVCTMGFENNQWLELDPIGHDADTQTIVAAGALLDNIRQVTLLPLNPLRICQKRGKTYLALRKALTRVCRMHVDATPQQVAQVQMSIFTSQNRALAGKVLKATSDREPIRVHAIDMAVAEALPAVEVLPLEVKTEGSGFLAALALCGSKGSVTGAGKFSSLQSFHNVQCQDITPFLLLQQAIVTATTKYCVPISNDSYPSHSLLMRGNVTTFSGANYGLRPYHTLLLSLFLQSSVLHELSETQQMLAMHALFQFLTPSPHTKPPQQIDVAEDSVVEENGIPIQLRQQEITLCRPNWTCYFGGVTEDSLIYEPEEPFPSAVNLFSKFSSISKRYQQIGNGRFSEQEQRRRCLARKQQHSLPPITKLIRSLESFNPAKNQLEELVFAQSSSAIRLLWRGLGNFKALLDLVNKTKAEESGTVTPTNSVPVKFQDEPQKEVTNVFKTPTQFRLRDPRGGKIEDVQVHFLEPEAGVVIPMPTTSTSDKTRPKGSIALEGPGLLEDSAVSDSSTLPVKSLLDTIASLHADGNVALEDVRALAGVDALKEHVRTAPPKVNAVYVHRHLLARASFKTTIQIMQRFHTNVQLFKMRRQNNQHAYLSTSITTENIMRPPSWSSILHNHTVNSSIEKQFLPLCDLTTLAAQAKPVAPSPPTRTTICFICEQRILGRAVTCMDCNHSFHHECKEEWTCQGYLGCPSACK